MAGTADWNKLFHAYVQMIDNLEFEIYWNSFFRVDPMDDYEKHHTKQ